jgi:alpha-1,6-mannosyltransferase
LIWVGFAAYLGVLRIAPALGGRVVWGAIALLVVGFALAPPLLSHDIYSYVDYARLGAVHGLDPYVHPPRAAAGDPAFAHVTWPDTTSAYGPLFTLATYPLAWLPVPTAVWALKAVAAVSVVGIAAICARLAPLRGVERLRVAAFVALNPLVLVQVVGGGHNDALAMLLVTIGVAAVLSAHELCGGAASMAALAVKASAGLVAPFALLGTRRDAPSPRPLAAGRARFLLGLALALVATIAVACLAFGWNWLGAVGLAGENQSRTSHLSVPVTLARLTGLGEAATRAAALALYMGLVVYLLAWTWRGNDWLRAAAWASFGLLLATSWLLPWYVIWALPLVALSRDRTLQLLLLALTAYQLGARIPL